MITILLHSSKSMAMATKPQIVRKPALIAKAQQLADYLRTLSPAEIAASMHVSADLAVKTQQLLTDWTSDPNRQTLAFDAFIGDIYSGLRPQEMTVRERDYADKCLWILSGLYGFIRPYDAIYPYRLEMGYRFPNPQFSSLYKFWGTTIAEQLPAEGHIVNVSSVEYTKVITPYVTAERIITPEFLTVDPKTKEPVFKTVHAKIARGAFARWLITSGEQDPTSFKNFTDLGYHYDARRSTPQAPVFICDTFAGKGLSIKMQAKARAAAGQKQV